MAYQLYLTGVLFPVTPEQIKLKIHGQNKTMQVINGEEINILNYAGLTDIDFDIVLPATKYPFAQYEDGFQPPEYYLSLLERLMFRRQPFRFVVLRGGVRGEDFSDTNMQVSLEDYSITEDAKNGCDVKVSISLKQYLPYKAQRLQIQQETETTQEVVVEEQRETQAAPQNTVYTVQKGDCLWNIAKKLLGSGQRYTEIYQLNKEQIQNPNLIYPGQVLNLPQ